MTHSFVRSVYHAPPRIVLDPQKPLPDPYFGFSREELEEEHARQEMLLIDTLEYSPWLPRRLRENDAAMYRSAIERLDRRIQRYQGRLTYGWPDRRRYEAMISIAQGMKEQYPLHEFILDTLPEVALRPSGSGWIGHCPHPLHDDRHPSFSVFDGRAFRCHGCGIRGDIFDLIGIVFGLERLSDRIEYLAGVLP